MADLERANTLLAALIHVAVRAQCTLDLDRVMGTIGTELERLGIYSYLALLAPEDEALIVSYVSPSVEAMTSIEGLTGAGMCGCRISREHFPPYNELIEQKQAVSVTNAAAIVSSQYPRLSGPAIERILQTIDARADTPAIYLSLMLEEKVLGVLAMWGSELCEEDAPVLSVFAGQVVAALEVSRLYEETQAEIAERKRAEEEQVRAHQALQESHRQLEEREQFISRVLDSIPSSLVVIDRGLRVVSANRNFMEKARREIKTTVGRRIEDVFPPVLLGYTQLPEQLQRIYCTGESVEGGKVAYRAPGLATRIYYYRLIPLKAGQEVENVMLLMDDVTEREQLGEEARRAERHLASIVECANDLVVSIDPEGCIMTWNQAAERASGLSNEQVRGQSLALLCAAEYRPVMAEALDRSVRGEQVHNVEVNLRTASGQELPVSWSYSLMRDDAGGVAGIVAVGRDLTERRRLEAQLIQSAKTASLGVMAGGIAHELRNPLAVVSASAQLLLEQPEEERLRAECAEKIHAATQRASLIIENLLKFARPKSERMSRVDLHKVLRETIALLEHQITLQKVSCRKALRSDRPMVRGNPDLLQQVFTNLILNARNAMPEGGKLTVATRTAESGEVEVLFRDTGCGIPKENLPKIYDPFFTTMPVGKGTGLGLSISYSIIQQHQGSIKVESQVGEGTTVLIRLPRDNGVRVLG